MNERILEIAKQCGYWSGQTIEMNDVGIEKFTQMIISLAVLKVYNNPQLYKDSNYSFEALLEDIRKDFGVE
jgi:hypothetical protein